MRFGEVVDRLAPRSYQFGIAVELLKMGIKGCTREDFWPVPPKTLLYSGWEEILDVLLSNGLMEVFGKPPNQVYQTTESGLEALRGYGCDV
jgi:hypothetical protein